MSLFAKKVGLLRPKNSFFKTHFGSLGLLKPPSSLRHSPNFFYRFPETYHFLTMIEILTSSSKAQPIMYPWFSRWRCFQYHSSLLRDFIWNLGRKYFLKPEFLTQSMLYLLWQEKCQWPFLKYTLPYPVILQWPKHKLLKKQANVLLNIEIHIHNIQITHIYWCSKKSYHLINFEAAQKF